MLKTNKHFIISAIITLALFFIFFPPFYTSTDEREYIQNAYYLTEGDLTLEDEQCFNGAYCGYFNNDQYVSKYNIGLSLIFAPVVLVHWKLTFIVTILTFVLSIYIFKKLLAENNIPQIFLYLYAFFPAFIYYSHKPQTEIFSLTFILAIYYLLFYKLKSVLNLKTQIALATVVGILSGLLVMIRYTNAILVIIFLAGFLVRNLKTSKKLTLTSVLGIVIGGLPFFLLFLYVNKVLYGDFITSGYSLSDEEFLYVDSLIFKQIFYYILFLNIIYPAMLLLNLKANIKGKVEILLSFLTFIIFYAGFPGYHFSSGILDLIFGLRFFVPIIPLIMLGYFDVINRFSFNTAFIYSLKFAIIVLVVNAVAMNVVYYNKLQDYKDKSDKIYSSTREGQTIHAPLQDRILINDAFGKGKRYIVLLDE